jgi:hypothetical protein
MDIVKDLRSQVDRFASLGFKIACTRQVIADLSVLVSGLEREKELRPNPVKEAAWVLLAAEHEEATIELSQLQAQLEELRIQLFEIQTIMREVHNEWGI